MNRDESKSCMKTLSGFYPSATDEQLSLVRERIAMRSFRATLAAIKTHAASRAFLDLPALFEGIHAANERARDRRREDSDLRVIQWIRRKSFESIASGGKDWAHGHPDKDVIEMYYRFCWQETCGTDAPQHGKDEVRRMIRNHTVGALFEIKMDVAEAKEIGDRCVA